VQQRAGRPFQRARLRYDSAFSLETGYAFEHGIPYSEYLQRWSNTDRAIVTAVTMEKADRCSMCGTAPWEWEADPYAYDPIYVTCPGCQRKEALADDDTPRPKGTTVRLVPKRVAARLARDASNHRVPRRRRRRSS
jgi:hypothetical protein